MKNAITLTLLALALPHFAATVAPADDGRALNNPGMGFVMHYYDNSCRNYGDTLPPGDDMRAFPGCTVVYLRLAWEFLEPEEGVFDWTTLDSVAQRWIDRGGQVAFRITTAETARGNPGVPKWLIDKGVKGTRYNFGWGPEHGPHPEGRLWEVDFSDPVYLKYLERFLSRLAAKYDGRDSVAFVDIGSYGTWGEGHSHGSSRPPAAKKAADLKLHIDLMRRTWPNTYLVISDDVDGGSNRDPAKWPILDYCRQLGIGFRDDSIMVGRPPHSWYHAEQAALYWPTMPVVLETEHYHMSLERGAWSPALFVESVEQYHPSYVSLHGDPWKILNGNKEAIDTINRRMGYRFNLRELSFDDSLVIAPGTTNAFSFAWRWANAGVAPVYRDAYPAITLKDAKGGIFAVLVDDSANLRRLKGCARNEAPDTLASSRKFAIARCGAPVVPSGKYELYVSVGDLSGHPVFELPLAVKTDGKRRYLLGTVDIQNSAR
ncbi:MAG: DUF4832 domain-containing protein [Kiritimatiellia bacterium]